MRIVKDFNDRRREFLDLAKEQFLSIGYDKVTIQMLTNRINVAKGTFYHYFDSKEDLLGQWVADETEKVMPLFDKIINDTNLNAIQKLNQLIKSGAEWKKDTIDMFILLMKTMYADTNIRMRAEMTKQSTLKMQHLFTQVIEQGVKEKLFAISFPNETAHIIIRLSQVFSEDLSRLLLAHYESCEESFEDALKLVAMWEDAIERILGAKKGAIHLTNNDLIATFYQYKTNKQ